MNDEHAIHELLTEIGNLLGCGDTCAARLYDRLKIIRRAIADVIDSRKDAEYRDAVTQAYNDLKREGADSDAICADLLFRLNQIDRGDFRRLEAKSAAEIIDECMNANRRRMLSKRREGF